VSNWKARTVAAFGGYVETRSRIENLHGGGCSLQRTRLRAEFPANRENNREKSPFRRNALAPYPSQTHVPCGLQQTRWHLMLKTNREFFSPYQGRSRGISGEEQGNACAAFSAMRPNGAVHPQTAFLDRARYGSLREKTAMLRHFQFVTIACLLPLSALCAGHASAGVSDPVVLPGNFTEFSDGISASASLYEITAGPDGNLWFTEYNGNRIGRITPDGIVTEFSEGITAGASPIGITVGPDGALWFTEEFRVFNIGLIGQIGRITTDGAVTEFKGGITAGPFDLAGLYGIAAGSDGNLWFTEAATDKIGRITPAGVVTEFDLTAGSSPHDITNGADGNLWFTERSASRIGRITTSGIVTEFSVGITANSSPFDITPGPGGNLWFTEEDGAQIAQITSLGVVTEFPPPPNAMVGPQQGLTTGPDGNLWYANSSGNIGQMTPLGDYTFEFTGITPPTNGSDFSNPFYITTGPDGNLWFTEIGANRIGRLNISDHLFANGFEEPMPLVY
jgi:streptogramin lyase